MHRTTLLPLLAMLAIVALPAAAATSIQIKSPTPTAGDYTMTVDVSSDFHLVEPTNPVAPVAKDTGHVHYFLNGKPCIDACAAGQAYATAKTTFTFHGLQSGDTVSAELVNNDHSSLDPAVKDAKTVEGSKSSAGVGPALFLALLALAAVAARRA